jgi:hypothetical protein
VTKAVNPKDAVGVKKAALRFVPPALMIEASGPMADGAGKYGPFNWRDIPIENVGYIEAVFRHLFAYLDGQDNAEDSGHSHLGHAIAGLGILADATANGNLIDTRYSKGPAADMLRARDRSIGVKFTEPPHIGKLSKPTYIEPVLGLDAVLNGTVPPVVLPPIISISSPCYDPTFCRPAGHSEFCSRMRANDVVMPPSFAEQDRINAKVTRSVAALDELTAKRDSVHGMERFKWDAYGGRYEGNEPILNPEWATCTHCGVTWGWHVLNCPNYTV